MARVELYCPYCSAKVATFIHGFMAPLYECESCGREVKYAELVRTPMHKRALAGAIKHSSVVGETPRGTASGTDNVTIENVALNPGDFLLVAVFEWHDGTATTAASMTWGSTPMSQGDTFASSYVNATFHTLFDIADTSPQNLFATKNDAGVQYITIFAISGTNAAGVVCSGGDDGVGATATCTVIGSGTVDALFAWTASYDASGAGSLGTFTQPADSSNNPVLSRTRSSVVSGWPTSDYTIDEATSASFEGSIPLPSFSATKVFPASHSWVIMAVGLA